MKRPAKLSATFCSKIAVPGTYGDGRGGHGLALRVKPTANGRLSKNWVQRLRMNGRPVNLGLGVFPVVTLAEARRKALENRRLAHRGEDPRGGGVPTFRQAAEKVIRLRAKSWKFGSRLPKLWMQTFEDYAFPRFGSKPVSEVMSADVLACLTPIWSEKPAQALRVRQRIGAVLRWSCAAGYRTDDPSAAVVEALPKQRATRHHRALHHSEVGDTLRRVNESGARRSTKLALTFLVLTATRSAEALEARWDEIDLDAGVWTIPPTRAKQKREHRVPLSKQALEVLAEARKLSRDERVFKIGKTTIRELFKRLGIAGTPHGMRTAFRSWCAENGVAREVAEAGLAHKAGGVESVYQRSDLFERRGEVMQAWADSAGKVAEGG